MGTITTLRPSATSSGVGWTPSTGTLHGVTSDDSDATYATWSGDGSALILTTPADAPPDGPQPKPKKSAWIGGGQRVSAVIRDLGYIKGNEDDLSPRSRERLLTSLKAAIARIEKAMVEQ